jgi:hypothetical protein
MAVSFLSPDRWPDRIYAGLFLLFLAGARAIIGRPIWIG